MACIDAAEVTEVLALRYASRTATERTLGDGGDCDDHHDNACFTSCYLFLANYVLLHSTVVNFSIAVIVSGLSTSISSLHCSTIRA